MIYLQKEETLYLYSDGALIKDLLSYNDIIDMNGAGVIQKNVVSTKATLHNQDIVRQEEIF